MAKEVAEGGLDYTNKLKRSRADAGLESPDLVTLQNHTQHEILDSDDDLESCDGSSGRSGTPAPKPGKKTRGRVKINMEFIDNKLRRYTTFSKRKSGIMKKAHELATLTGTQVMLLVASETGHVYTFATRKLQPILSSEAGKQLIQTCLNSPDPPDANVNQNFDKERMSEQRMSAQGFEEPDLSYAPPEETKDGIVQKSFVHEITEVPTHPQNSESPREHVSPTSTPQAIGNSNIVLASQVPVNLVAMSNPTNATSLNSLHLPYTFVTDSAQVQHRSIDLTNVHSHPMTRLPQSTQQTTFSQTSIMQYSQNIGMQPVLWSPALQVPQPVALVEQPMTEKKK